MIESFLAKFALKFVIGFYQKNPWAILPTVVIGALPVILVVSLVLGLIGGLVKPVVASDSVSCDSSTAAVDSLFKDTKVSDYGKQRQALYGSDCQQYGDNTGILSFYDYDGWFDITEELKDLIGKPYDQGKIDELLTKAIAATGVNMEGKGASQSLKDQIKNEFNDIVNKNKGKATVWKALDTWAQQYLSMSLGSSQIGQKIADAAKTRVGLPYVTYASSFNSSKQCYNGDGGECGFNCAGLASWAWGQAVGAKSVLYSQPYGVISSTQLYNYIINNKLGHVIDNATAQPGDFIFTLNKSGSFSGEFDHTAIYVGSTEYRNTTTPQYAEAANEDAGVRLTSGWWSSFYHVTVRLAVSDEQAADADAAASGTGDQSSHSQQAALAQAYAKSYMASKYNWDDTEFKCLVPLWNGESGWRYDALNATSDGNPAADPNKDAYGIPQSWPGSKMASAGSDWLTNYKTQIKWGLAYIKNSSSYGTPCTAWTKWQARSPHWY